MIARRRTPIILSLVFATSAALIGPAFGAESVSSRRLAGGDRYETGAAIAQATFPSGSRTAVLASGEGFPDALAASYLAGRLNAPLLLTAGASLSGAARDQLSSMGVSGVSIVGGPAAVSDNVAAQLRAAGYQVDRVFGNDRYATAREITEVFPASFVGALGDGGPTAFVASGENFPDALAGAPISFSEAFPVLLTPRATLSRDASAAFTSLEISQVVLLGGAAAVSADVEAQIESRGIDVIRLFGSTRQQTATEVADFAVDNLGWSNSHVNLARGDSFADALAGGPHEGVERAPVVLTASPTTLGDVTRDWLRSRSETLATIDVLGGRAAVSDATVDSARQAATTSTP